MVAFLSVNIDSIFIAMGKDPTLTGRTVLWIEVIHSIQERQWLGYGYSAFWLGRSSESDRIWNSIHWEAPHSHNGYLDLILELGLIGFGLYIILFLSVMKRSLHQFRNNYFSAYIWPILYLTFIFIYNLVESNILKSNNLFWVLFVAVAFSLLKIKKLEKNLIVRSKSKI